MKQTVLVLATKNQGKVKEMKQLLASASLHWEIKCLTDFPDCPEVVEDGETFEQNARKKANVISEYLQLPALADDSGLEVDALGGRPGVYSARFAGLHATDQDNNRKLIELVREVPPEKRQARFRCVLALAVPGRDDIWTCEGVCDGEIILKPRGSHGFGYDPIFYLREEKKTMAELTQEEKNKISHRGKAMRKLLAKLTEGF